MVQRYIDNPYLIGGRKFDLRVYVLVTFVSYLRSCSDNTTQYTYQCSCRVYFFLMRVHFSVNHPSCPIIHIVYDLCLQYIPLKFWLYRGGFARFSNTRFTPDSIDDSCILSQSKCKRQFFSPSFSRTSFVGPLVIA